MDYKTFIPHPDLNGFVRCYWTLEAPAEIPAQKQRIVPDGCIEMIFHFGDLYKQHLPDGTNLIQPRCFVFGQITESLEIEPTGHTGIFSVRFQPDGFAPFIEKPIRDIENRAVPLNEVFGEDLSQLETEILTAKSTEERISKIDQFLLEKIGSKKFLDNITKSSIDLILQLNGQLSVGELSDQLKINRRQLERKFSEAIGLSPKQLSKIIRIQATLKMLANKQFTSLTAIAYEGNYYDQTHFIKDFKEFTGMSPKKFYANNLKMSSLFIGCD